MGMPQMLATDRSGNECRLLNVSHYDTRMHKCPFRGRVEPSDREPKVSGEMFIAVVGPQAMGAFLSEEAHIFPGDAALSG